MEDIYNKDDLTISNLTRNKQVFENRRGEKIGYLLYSIIFVVIFISAFAESGLIIAGNLLGINSGLLFGFHKIKKYMELDSDRSKAKAYWYILIVLEIILGVSLYFSVIENYVVFIFSVFFIFFFTSLVHQILLNVFSTVTLTIIPREAYMELQSHIKFFFLNKHIIYEIPYEARLLLYRATLFDKPDNISTSVYYVQVRRPEGIVKYNIKLKAMLSNGIYDIEELFKEVTNFEISPKLQNAIKREKKLMRFILIMTILSLILLYPLGFFFG